ncbi:hypothetical protein [uncultured Pseudoramibacter sp.]|uniref:hypothetical protein n=1 Tax=uncultured Pseudoramibacter sp. TaxID=1623493 RepID=UPI0025FD236C|nr:hypothetical protein [uncultured Pseudoramibacter sp.]
MGLDTSKSRLNSKLNKELTYLSDHSVSLTRYYIFFGNNNKIFFPSWYTLNQKKELINDFVYYFYDLFSYNLPKANNDLTPKHIEYRLNILATYLLQDQFKRKSGIIITDYKRKKINNTEIPLNTLEIPY